MSRIRLRCSSCGRTVALAASPRSPHRVYCDAWCAEEEHITRQEHRNSEWEMLFRVRGLTPVQIAREYKVHHPLVYRVLDRLGVRKPAQC